MFSIVKGAKKVGILIVMLGAFSLFGCGGTDVRNQTTTTGQELLDLKGALDAGVITEKEYERKRKDILKRS